MFKSPVSKVVEFLGKSRKGWKAKCLKAKQEKKLLANQTRAVEKSRDHWKQMAQAARQQVRDLERQLERLKFAAPHTEQSTYA